MKTNICDYLSVPVPTELFIQLSEFLRAKDDRRAPVAAVWDAISYWIDNADWKPELIRANDGLGYQWKSLFLPQGTQVRMQYKGSYFYAKVEGDRLMYDGKSYSPGSFANKIAGCSRNAWRDLWIKRPADSEWALADDLRGEAES